MLSFINSFKRSAFSGQATLRQLLSTTPGNLRSMASADVTTAVRAICLLSLTQLVSSLGDTHSTTSNMRSWHQLPEPARRTRSPQRVVPVPHEHARAIRNVCGKLRAAGLPAADHPMADPGREGLTSRACFSLLACINTPTKPA